MNTTTNHGNSVPLPECRRPVPDWVIQAVAKLGSYEPLGSGYVLMRDGVVIDRWYPR